MRRYGKLLVLAVLLFGCEQKSNPDLMEIFNCDDSYCSTVVYEINISLHNFKLLAPTMSYSKEEIIKYCLTTNPACGADIYGSLNKLIKSDSSKFYRLKEKYEMTEVYSFIDYMAASPSDYEQKSSDLINELKQLCECK